MIYQDYKQLLKMGKEQKPCNQQSKKDSTGSSSPTEEENSEHIPLRVIVSVRFLELLFIATIGTLLYWIFTLNYKALLLSLCFSIMQSFVKGRCQPYIHFINHVMGCPKFFKIRRFYEEPEAQWPDKEKTMLAFHPHSIYSLGVLLNMNYPAKQGYGSKVSSTISLSSRFMLNIPIVGLMIRLWGIQSVDADTMKKLMSEGKTISLVPGGYEQATLTSTREMRIFIKQRKGFIKYALKYGYTIRPVLIMNEHQAYKTVQGGLKWRMLLNKIKMPGVIFGHPRYGLLFPPNIKMDTIIGSGIDCSRFSKPADDSLLTETINKVHGMYIKQVEGLYEKHKQKNGNLPLKVY